MKTNSKLNIALSEIIPIDIWSLSGKKCRTRMSDHPRRAVYVKKT